MIFDKYPYTNFHEMNDDWIIKTLREFGQRLDEFVAANSLTYADPITYDPDTPYPMNTVVILGDVAYVSKKAVPAGMLPSAESDYWLLIFPFGELIRESVNESEAALSERIDTYLATVTATLPSMVNSWMDSHPDITTPIPNGAVSWPKLVSSLKHVILAGYAEESESVTIDDFTQGTIAGLGVETAATNACRTGYITLAEGIYQIRAAAGFVAKIWSYRLNDSFDAVALENVDIQWNAFAAHDDRKYRVTIMKENLSDFTPSDLPLIPVWYYANLPRYAYKTDLPVTIIPVTLVRENGYRKRDGTIFGTTTQYFHSTFNAQRGDIIILDYVDCATNVSVFGYFIDETYIHIKGGEGGTDVKHLESEPLPADCIVSISGRGSDFENTTVKIARAAEDNIKEIVAFIRPILDADESVQWQFALDSVLCIGDSLTKGVPANTSTMPNPMKQNYPFYLSRMIETVCTNAGYAGIKTSEWYLNHYSDYAMTDYNAVIIFLGTNGQLTDTLETDVEPYDDYNDYAATETGYYCKLIEHIQADNDNMIIVLVNVWRVNTGGDTARTVIEKIGQKYSLPVVDTYDLRYDVHPEYHGGSNNVHMAKAGYLALANRIQHALRLYLSEHVNDVNKGMTGQS